MALKPLHRRDQKNVAAEHDALEGHGLLQLEQADAAIELERIVPYIANRLTFRLNRLLKQDLKPFGLSIVKWRVLAVLAENEKATITEIAEYAMLEQPTASRLILRMEMEKLIARERDPVDGRVRSISLTSLGKEKYRAARSKAMAHAARAVADFSDAEREQLTGLLLRMTSNIDEASKSSR